MPRSGCDGADQRFESRCPAAGWPVEIESRRDTIPTSQHYFHNTFTLWRSQACIKPSLPGSGRGSIISANVAGSLYFATDERTARTHRRTKRSETKKRGLAMKFLARGLNANRRWFMKKASGVVGATTVGTRLLADSPKLGGNQDKEVPGGSGNPIYTAKLQNFDSDFRQYVHDNTDDEITHFTFLNAYPTSNLTRLTLDTSWWTRYRSSANNPDLDANFVFPQAVPDLAAGQFTAIPRTAADLTPDAHIQAIANTNGFHMSTIEQGGKEY
jgi:hypothetical protein